MRHKIDSMDELNSWENKDGEIDGGKLDRIAYRSGLYGERSKPDADAAQVPTTQDIDDILSAVHGHKKLGTETVGLLKQYFSGNLSVAAVGKTRYRDYWTRKQPIMKNVILSVLQKRYGNDYHPIDSHVFPLPLAKPDTFKAPCTTYWENRFVPKDLIVRPQTKRRGGLISEPGLNPGCVFLLPREWRPDIIAPMEATVSRRSFRHVIRIYVPEPPCCDRYIIFAY